MTAVLSPTGEAAIYNYDPAGNFTSITRRAANELSIIEFTPGSGSTGTPVTIYGTGFNTTPSANTVKFNGVTATVTAATKTRLDVSVPAGATTGVINVTNSNGAINSGNQFYIVSRTIYFSGHINFGESLVVPANPTPPPSSTALITFDGTANQRISLVMEDLTFPPPSGVGSTHATVNVVAPSGATIAATDVYDHPDVLGQFGLPLGFGFLEPVTLPANGTYTILIDHNPVKRVGMTLRLYDVSPDITGPINANGTPLPVSFASPGQNARLTFSGAAGRRVSFRALQPVSTAITTNLALIKPDGTNLLTSTVNSDRFVEPATLPVNGTYTILLDPQYNKTQTTTLYLYDMPPDVTGSVSIGGSPFSVPISTPGQNANLSLSVPATQTVTIHATEHNIRDSVINSGVLASVTISLLNSSGATVATTTTSVSSWSLAVPNLGAGNYTIKVDPSGPSTGSIKINVTSP